MKKFLVSLFLIGTAAILFSALEGTEAHSTSTGAPAGKTGSPGDASNCTGCHTGSTATTVAGMITSDIPPSGYVPGMLYSITATISKMGINKFGFEISPQNSTGQLKGTLSLSDPGRTQLLSAGKYVTHTSSGNVATANSTTWSCKWTAPAVGTGALTFYGAFVAANGLNNNTGDQVFLSSLPVQENTSVGISKLQNRSDWNVFPVPCSGILNVDLNNLEEEEFELCIRDLLGNTVKEEKIQTGRAAAWKTDISGLAQGVYLLHLKNKNGEIYLTKKIIKE